VAILKIAKDQAITVNNNTAAVVVRKAAKAREAVAVRKVATAREAVAVARDTIGRRVRSMILKYNGFQPANYLTIATF